MSRARQLALIAAVVVSAACAARSGRETEPAPQTPAAPESPATQPALGQPGTEPDAVDEDRGLADDFSSVEAAEAALEKARAELGASEATKASAAPKASRRDEKAADARPLPAKPEPKAAGELDRCVNACKAFASLKRAASAVCRLAGETSDRCKRAQGIVRDSESRVAPCNCAADGG